MKFVAGQRVRYVGEMTPEVKGEEGTVIRHTHTDTVVVRWDNKTLNNYYDSWGVLPESIIVIDEVFKYDPKQADDQDDDI